MLITTAIKAEIDADIREDERKSEAIAEKVLADKNSLYSRLQRYRQDDDFRAALSEAMEASNDERPALIKALFAKMDASEIGRIADIAEHAEKTIE